MPLLLFLNHAPLVVFALDQGGRSVLAPIISSDPDKVDAPMKYLVASMAVLACAMGPVQAQSVGDPMKRAVIARQVCAECHAVERGQRQSSNAHAPAFEAVAKMPGMTSIALTAALRTSHRVMPDIVLSDEQLRNVVAYFLSLKQS
jgi:mono/diheme cytochrome c family protein